MPVYSNTRTTFRIQPSLPKLTRPPKKAIKPPTATSNSINQVISQSKAAMKDGLSGSDMDEEIDDDLIGELHRDLKKEKVEDEY